MINIIKNSWYLYFDRFNPIKLKVNAFELKYIPKGSLDMFKQYVFLSLPFYINCQFITMNIFSPGKIWSCFLVQSSVTYDIKTSLLIPYLEFSIVYRIAFWTTKLLWATIYIQIRYTNLPISSIVWTYLRKNSTTSIWTMVYR